MIDFTLTEEQKALQDLAADFTRNEIIPKAAEYDQSGKYPHEILQKAWELGLMNINIPEKYGGMELGVLDSCISAEEIAYGCTGIGTAMEANNLAEAPLIVVDNEQINKKYLQPMTEKYALAAYCVTEPNAGSDVAGIRTTAVKKGDTYLVSGEKMWITNAGVADWFFVLAYTDKAKGHKGISAFVVDANAAGITIGKKEINMGQRASDTRGIRFEEVEIPAAQLLGKEGDGFKIAMAAFDHTRPLIASAATGLARRAMEESIKYAGERTTFGVPIHQHQAIAFMVSRMAHDIEAARLLTWKAAWLKDQGRRNTRHAAMAKAFAADTAMRVATDAVQIHGGYGFNTEFPVEKLMRDAKIFQIYEGTSQIQRLIISREIFERK